MTNEPTWLRLSDGSLCRVYQVPPPRRGWRDMLWVWALPGPTLRLVRRRDLTPATPSAAETLEWATLTLEEGGYR